MASPSSDRSDCSATLLTSEDAYLGVLGRIASKNYAVLAISAVVIVGAGVVLWIIGSMAWQTWSLYRSITARPHDDRRKKARASAASADDEVYNADVVDHSPQYSDATLVKSAMERLKGRYAGYNRAVTDFDRDVKGRAPTDLVDEKILSQKHDDYRYETRAELDRDAHLQRRGAESQKEGGRERNPWSPPPSAGSS